MFKKSSFPPVQLNKVIEEASLDDILGCPEILLSLRDETIAEIRREGMSKETHRLDRDEYSKRLRALMAKSEKLPHWGEDERGEYLEELFTLISNRTDFLRDRPEWKYFENEDLRELVAFAEAIIEGAISHPHPEWFEGFIEMWEGLRRMPQSREEEGIMSYAVLFGAMMADMKQELKGNVKYIAKYLALKKGGSDGGRKAGANRTAARKSVWDALQAEADKIWAKHPTWGVPAVAQHVQKRFPKEKVRTIQAHIKKPRITQSSD